LTQRNVLPLLWVGVVCLLLAHNVYLWLGKRIVLDTDILALLPVQQRDPVLQLAFTHMVDAAQQRLIVLVGAPDWVQAGRAADAFRDVLVPHRELVQVATGVADREEIDWLAPFQAHRLVLLTAPQEAALRHEPAQYWIDSALSQIYNPFAGFKLGAWRDDPFGLFGGWVQARSQETPVRPRDGRLFVGDRRDQYVVLPITLRVPAFSMAAHQTLMPLLEQARQAADKAVPEVEIIKAGVILHVAADAARARREVSTIGIGSILGMVLLMWVAFHSLKPIALIMLSISVGCLGALSLCWLMFDRLHLLTLVFGASLIGVAQDYGIYFLCRRYAADSTLDSWRLLRRLLPPLVLTLVTTVIGYMGLVVTPFPGLRQMAVFSVIGLLFAWLTVFFWFPNLVGPGTHQFGLAQRYAAGLARWPLALRNRATLWAVLAFGAFAVVGWSRLYVQDDIRSLQNPPKKLLDDQILVSRLLDAPTPAQFYLVRGSTAEAVLQREEQLKHRLEPLIEKQVISGYQALSNWVPSLRTQETRRNLIDRNLLREGGALATLAARIGADEQWVAATRDRLLASAAPLLPEEFLTTPASEPWRYLWLGQVSGGYATIVALRGVGKTSLPALRDAASGLDGLQWVDKVDEISSVLGAYRYYMSWVVLASFFGVYGLLYPRYGRAGWRVLAPTALASIATLALLGITGQPLQLFHVLALMLLLGIGVDYGIFLQEQPDARDDSAWLAIGLSTWSTLLSFGLLGLSHMPALRAFGLTMSIGIAAVWLILHYFGTDKNDRGTEVQSLSSDSRL
jgi:predicted exporter